MSVPEIEVMGQPVTLRGLKGHPGLNPESGVKNPPGIWPRYTQRQTGPCQNPNAGMNAYRQLVVPVHWHVFQVSDGSYNLWVAASSPNHPGGRCGQSQRDGTGRKPLAHNRRRWTCLILNTCAQICNKLLNITLFPCVNLRSYLFFLQGGLNVTLQQPAGNKAECVKGFYVHLLAFLKVFKGDGGAVWCCSSSRR